MKNVVIVPNFFVLVVTVVLFCFISLCCFFLFFFFVCLFFDCPIIVIFMHYSSRWSLETNLVFPAASFKKSQKNNEFNITVSNSGIIFKFLPLKSIRQNNFKLWISQARSHVTPSHAFFKDVTKILKLYFAMS